MYRSPVSQQYFTDKYVYRSYLNEVMWANELPWTQYRKLIKKYQAGRAEFQKLTKFSDIIAWLKTNRDLIVQVPTIGINARGRNGKVTSFSDIVVEGTLFKNDINSEHIHFRDELFNHHIEGHSGWLFRGYLVPTPGRDPRFSIMDNLRGLTTYGFYISDYNHESRPDLPSVYAFQAFMLTRDFPQLAMMEKLIGRISGTLSFVA